MAPYLLPTRNPKQEAKCSRDRKLRIVNPNLFQRSDMARTMTSSSSPVPDPVDSDEAYGSGMISAESIHGAISQQVQCHNI